MSHVFVADEPVKDVPESGDLEKIKIDIQIKKKEEKRRQFDISHPGIAKLRAELLGNAYREMENQAYIKKKSKSKKADKPVEPTEPAEPAPPTEPTKPAEPSPPASTKPVPPARPIRVAVGASW